MKNVEIRRQRWTWLLVPLIATSMIIEYQLFEVSAVLRHFPRVSADLTNEVVDVLSSAVIDRLVADVWMFRMLLLGQVAVMCMAFWKVSGASVFAKASTLSLLATLYILATLFRPIA